MTKKETLSFLSDVARCVRHAADATGREHELNELRRVITEMEREHRAFGRRLVGSIGMRMSVSAATDYFVARVIAEGITVHRAGKAPISSLCGMREDYVRGAVLVSNEAFRASLLKRLHETFAMRPAAVWAKIAETDYCALVSA